MDGTGKLLHNQFCLWNNFEVRCLSIPSDDYSNWLNLTEKVILLIQQELNNNHFDHVYLCGESFGGCLALKLIENQPSLFDRLILINPASSFQKRSWLNLGSVITQVIPDFIYFNSTSILLPFLAKLERIKPHLHQDLLTAMQSISPKTVSWRISLLNQFNVINFKLRNFTRPVLIIASALDDILPSTEEASRLSLLFPNTQLKILPFSGHSCLLEKDINLYEILKQFNF